MAKGYRGGAMRGGMPRGGMGMGGMNQMDLMKQAQKMQEDMLKAQAELETRSYTANAGGGAVSATVSGKRVLTEAKIFP